MRTKGDFYFLYLAIIFIIGGVYAIKQNNLFTEQKLNISGGIAFLFTGVVLICLFIRQVKRRGDK